MYRPVPDLPSGEGRTRPEGRPAQIGTLESVTHYLTSPRPKSRWAGRSASNSTHGMAPLRVGTEANLRTGTDPATGYLSSGLPVAWFPAADFSVTPANRHRLLLPPVFRKSSPRPPAVAATCRRHGFLPRIFPPLRPIGTDYSSPVFRKSSPRPPAVCDLLFTFALH